MNRYIEESFHVPEQIIRGLEDDSYERIGGIIRNKNTKDIVYWLREGGQPEKNTEIIMIKSTSLGKATLALTDFNYLNESFKEIRKKLEVALMESDLRNMTKIESGFSLSKEAESIEDHDSSRFQMIHAMSLLEEGLNIYRNIHEQQRKNDKKIRFISYDSLRLVVLSKMGIIRSYALLGEYNIAALRIQKLKNFLLDCALWYCRRRCHGDIEWYEWIYIAPLYIPGKIMSKLKDYATVEWKVLEEIRRCRKENVSIQDTLEIFIDKMQKREIDIPVEVQELIDHLDYIDGYSMEIEAYKNRPVKFKKICDEISNKGAMELN